MINSSRRDGQVEQIPMPEGLQIKNKGSISLQRVEKTKNAGNMGFSVPCVISAALCGKKFYFYWIPTPQDVCQATFKHGNEGKLGGYGKRSGRDADFTKT